MRVCTSLYLSLIFTTIVDLCRTNVFSKADSQLSFPQLNLIIFAALLAEWGLLETNSELAAIVS